MSFLSTEIRNIRSSSLAHNAGWMFAGQGLTLLIQAAYFILLARLLGVQEYGVFVGAFAFVSLATPYSALGSGLVFMQHVSSNPENFAAYWGNIVLSTLSGGLLITGLLYLIAPHLLNAESASIVLIVALGECMCRQLVACIGQLFQAFEQLRMTAGIASIASLLRLLAVAVLALLLHRATARQWALTSLVISVIAALISSAVVIAFHGRPRFQPRLLLRRLGEGLNFSLAGSSQFAYNDIDKVLLSHYGMNVANGIYTMAYRIVDFATVPVTAVDAAALPHFFRKSQEGVAVVRGLSVRLAWRAALIGALAAGCIFFAAPLIPYVVGKGFSESVAAFRWLCLIPAFRGVHQLTGSAITGLGFQRYRTMVQLAAAASNFLLNLWLIPHYGWLGAAWASLATDGGLAIVNWFLLLSLQGRFWSREQPGVEELETVKQDPSESRTFPLGTEGTHGSQVTVSNSLVRNPPPAPAEPRISVALCTFNGERYLLEQLYSIAKQSVLPDELVICDDGSSDATPQILRDFVRSAPFDVRFIRNLTPLGTAKNFEKAITLCRGRLIALADQDDIWNPEKLSRCADALECDANLGGVFSDAELIDSKSTSLGLRLWPSVHFHPNDDRIDREQFTKLLLKQHVATGATIVFRSEFRRFILPIPDSWIQDAWIIWMLVLFSNLGLIREPLMQYRIHPGQQIGITSKSLRNRIGAARLAGNGQYNIIARRFEDLREHLVEQSVPWLSLYLTDLDRKIQLLRFQAKLADNRFVRLGQIMIALPSYLRYTRGLPTICRDLLG